MTISHSKNYIMHIYSKKINGKNVICTQTRIPFSTKPLLIWGVSISNLEILATFPSNSKKAEGEN